MLPKKPDINEVVSYILFLLQVAIYGAILAWLIITWILPLFF